MVSKWRITLGAGGLLFVAAGGAIFAVAQLDGNEDLTAYCATLRQLRVSQESGQADKADFEKISALIGKLATQAPDSLRDQAETYAHGINEFMSDLRAVGYKPEKIKPEQIERMRTAEMNSAIQEIKSSEAICKPGTAPSVVTSPQSPPR
ncbi:hypothetical protein ACWCQK_41355 [Streptomyces sp. NPDC002306]